MQKNDCEIPQSFFCIYCRRKYLLPLNCLFAVGAFFYIYFGAPKKACRTDKLNPKAYKNTGLPKTKGFWEKEKQHNE